MKFIYLFTLLLRAKLTLRNHSFFCAPRWFYTVESFLLMSIKCNLWILEKRIYVLLVMTLLSYRVSFFNVDGEKVKRPDICPVCSDALYDPINLVTFSFCHWQQLNWINFIYYFLFRSWHSTTLKKYVDRNQKITLQHLSSGKSINKLADDNDWLKSSANLWTDKKDRGEAVWWLFEY